MAKKFNKKRKSEIEAKQAMNRDTARGNAKRAKAAEAAAAYLNSISPIKYGTKKPGTPVAKPAALKASGFIPPSAATDPKRLLDKKEWKKAAEYALEGNLGISSKNSAGTNAGLLAMAALPIPAPLKGAAGKGARAVAANAAKSAARRTASESATIRKGTQAGRTAEKAVELEKAAAKESSSKSVNTARQSTVELRTPTSRKKMSKKELQERLDIGARMRAEGRRPGDDIPNRDGSVNVGTSASKTPKAKDPAKPTPREKNVAEFQRGLKKPTNPGANASAAKKAKYQKDLAAYEQRVAQMNRRTKLTDEGYLKADSGAPKGAAAKSVARNERKTAKKPSAPKKPSVAKAAAEGPKTGTALAVRSSKVATRPSKVATRPSKVATTSKPASQQTVRGEVVRNSDWWRSVPRGSGRGQRAIEGPKTGATAAGGKRFSKTKKALLAAGAIGAAGLALKNLDSDKSPNEVRATGGAEGPKRSIPVKRSAPKVLVDNKGRKISREEFNRRAEFRKSIGIEPRKAGESLAEYRKRAAAARAKNKAATKAEMERRAKYRKTEGKKQFGSAAKVKTRQRGSARVDVRDERARQALR